MGVANVDKENTLLVSPDENYKFSSYTNGELISSSGLVSSRIGIFEPSKISISMGNQSPLAPLGKALDAPLFSGVDKSNTVDVRRTAIHTPDFKAWCEFSDYYPAQSRKETALSRILCHQEDTAIIAYYIKALLNVVVERNLKMKGNSIDLEAGLSNILLNADNKDVESPCETWITFEHENHGLSEAAQIQQFFHVVFSALAPELSGAKAKNGETRLSCKKAWERIDELESKHHNKPWLLLFYTQIITKEMSIKTWAQVVTEIDSLVTAKAPPENALEKLKVQIVAEVAVQQQLPVAEAPNKQQEQKKAKALKSPLSAKNPNKPSRWSRFKSLFHWPSVKIGAGMATTLVTGFASGALGLTLMPALGLPIIILAGVGVGLVLGLLVYWLIPNRRVTA